MKICITGTPCSGKSTAMSFIKEAGYHTFVADEYVHSIYKHNKIGYKAIKETFGDKYVNKIEVDRKALGSLVFSDKKALIKLNNLMNPIIAKKIKSLSKKYDWFIELATYIYYPQNFANLFDKIILIFSNENWKKEYQIKKFSYLKKIPTICVDKSNKAKGSILYIDNKVGNNYPINVDIFVNNCQNKKYLKNNILKICKKINQNIIM